MNLWQKIQKVKCELQEKPLKKSGYQKFKNGGGFNFFELSDFLPILNSLLDKNNLCDKITFEGEEVVLTIINCENPEEREEYRSKVVYSNSTNREDIQNLGATHTFLRRYMYILAFNISENDIVDFDGDNGPKTPTSKTKANVNVNKIEKLLATKEVNQEAFIQFAKSTYKINDLTQLNDNQAKELIGMLQAKADKHA